MKKKDGGSIAQSEVSWLLDTDDVKKSIKKSLNEYIFRELENFQYFKGIELEYKNSYLCWFYKRILPTINFDEPFLYEKNEPMRKVYFIMEGSVEFIGFMNNPYMKFG